MRNLLNFLARYNNLILFLLFEGIALYLVATRNNYHNSRIINGIKGITRVVEKEITNTRDYFYLDQINAKLAIENAALRNTLDGLRKKDSLLFFSLSDTSLRQQYIYTSAEIVNNSVNRQKNFFTLNKGKNQGIGIDMAVVTSFGIAGLVVGCSDNYSLAMSVLNLDFRLSCRIKTSGYFGSLTWDGRDIRYAQLNEIPQHVEINLGDTIETTNYSAIFPQGIMVGVISDFKKSGGDFYKITIALATDYRKLNFVTIIGNLKRTEQITLEKQVQ
jgi:rod shape-determining protein MreC